MPPAPSGATISYGPRRWPAASVTGPPRGACLARVYPSATARWSRPHRAGATTPASVQQAGLAADLAAGVQRGVEVHVGRAGAHLFDQRVEFDARHVGRGERALHERALRDAEGGRLDWQQGDAHGSVDTRGGGG